MRGTSIHRRHWLRLAGSAAASAAFGQARVGVAFIGVGERGTGLLKVLLSFPEVDIPAVCDIDARNLSRALDLVQKARGRRPEGYDDYRRMLARDDFRAVLIATPQELHGRMSLDALRAGKFTASEVPACTTLDECWELVRTQRKTRAGYMLLEANMAAKGLFGDLTDAECAYIREIRAMRFQPDGSLTWRGENVALYQEGRIPAHTWEPLERYRPEHDHPYWAARGGEAAKTGHSGGDYFVLSDLLEAIRTGESPIDVVDAATWSCLRPLSAESLRKGSAPIDIPNFKV